MAPGADDLFLHIAAVLVLASIAGAVGILLRQPLIVSFLAAGILAGPSGLALSSAEEVVGLLGGLGIALLLFLVGLRLDPRELRRRGPVAMATGGGQVVFTSIVGYGLALLLGLPPVQALYVAVALTFSSTIIIVKLLSDKRELDTLHGRIAVGFLIVQDLFVILVLAVLSILGPRSDSPWWDLLLTLGQGTALIAVAWAAMAFARRTILKRLARSKELLVIASAAWAIGLGAAAEAVGLSRELGAFLAGVLLASTPYRDAIGSRLIALRDFLLLFFFVDLGSNLQLGLLGAQVVPAVVLSLFVLVGNPAIVMTIMGTMGYRSKTSFLAGLTVAQISEFSLVLVALGLSMGHLTADTVGLVTLVGLVTISTSTYLILNSDRIHSVLAPALRIFERKRPRQERDTKDDKEGFDVILYGLGRYGQALARALREDDVRVLAVEVDPEVTMKAHTEGLPVRYGDAENPEFPQHLPLSQVQWVISTIPDLHANRVLVEALRHHGYKGRIAVTVHGPGVTEALHQIDADRILLPFSTAASAAAHAIRDSLD